MSKQLTDREQQLIEDIIGELTIEINNLRDDALRNASIILNREVNIQSLNGIVGGKNNTYVDSVKTQFFGFEDFFSKWLQGLNDTFVSERITYLKYNSDFDWNAKASFKNVRLLKDEKIFKYTEIFLERNFYKHITIIKVYF